MILIEIIGCLLHDFTNANLEYMIGAKKDFAAVLSLKNRRGDCCLDNEWVSGRNEGCDQESNK